MVRYFGRKRVISKGEPEFRGAGRRRGGSKALKDCGRKAAAGLCPDAVALKEISARKHLSALGF